MNRTVEKILGIVGFLMDGALAIFGIVGILLLNSGIDLLEGSIDPADFGVLSNVGSFLSIFIWIPIIGAVISFTLGLIGVLQLKRNPKTAGGFFIAAAVLSGWLLLSGILFQSLLYLAAAIMCFVRKPTDTIES
ncbi:hypothetical protein CAI16_09970 [Virgibacillus dokdonensis]|uniref:DUF4064 domain-containing protein n=2 Tax=Virgibacillus TaxID=84406 RepID=A0A1M5XJ04_9BACI|nr:MULTISPECIES: DUF4064 domain-containing protein [Virgibacillus]RFA34923.1 hypothetical protein CAI16_09970 [Virgibacillus dokdonensis]SHH99729.1 Protein of unknown function [Virgibacillus chiguensis]